MPVGAVAVRRPTHLVQGHILLQMAEQVVEGLDILETVPQHQELQIGAVVVEVLAQVVAQPLPELVAQAAPVS
jgi:hypothetical protein